MHIVWQAHQSIRKVPPVLRLCSARAVDGLTFFTKGNCQSNNINNGDNARQFYSVKYQAMRPVCAEGRLSLYILQVL